MTTGVFSHLFRLDSFGSWRSPLSPEYEREFADSLSRANLARVRVFSVLLLLTNVLLLVRDIVITQPSGMWAENTAYRDLFYLHSVLGVGAALFLLVSMVLRRGKKSTRAGNVITAIFAAFILYWCAVLAAGVNTFIHGQITEYIIAVFGVAVAFFLRPGTSSLVFISAQITFMILLGVVLDDPNYSGHYTNSIIFTLLAWSLSVITFMSRRREFLAKKTIETQTAAVEAANRELQSRNAELAQLNEEKNEIIGIAAHDLKNPLAGIILNVDVVVSFFDRMKRDDIMREMQRIDQSARRMSEIITNILDINAIETGRRDYTVESVDISQLTLNTVEEYRRSAEVKRITIHTEIRTPLFIEADRNAMLQILDNLISNAVKYSPHGKNIRVRAKNYTTATVPVARLEVQDEGAGLTEEDKTRLFGKFARLSARPTGNEHSTGLGLSIVKKLVETAQGRIWCESKAGYGATFIVELPLSQISASNPSYN
jgi:signal transduction histidine kinase